MVILVRMPDADRKTTADGTGPAREPLDMLLPWCARGFLILVGIIFLLSGLAKILQFHLFLNQLDGYLVVPEPLLSPAAIVVVILEILCGGAFFVPRLQKIGAVVAVGMLLFFSVAISVSLFNHMEINCGCLGPLSRPVDKISWWLMVRDVVLAVLAGTALVVSKPAEYKGQMWTWRWRFALAGAGTVAIALTMLLTQRNRILDTNLNAMAHPEVREPVGEHLEPFDAARIGQKPGKIDFSASEATWLLIFSPTCHHCQQIIPIWNQMWLYSNVEHGLDTRILGISIDKDVSMDFVKQYGIRFPVYVPTNPSKFTSGINATVPCAILVDRNGNMLKELIYYPQK